MNRLNRKEMIVSLLLATACGGSTVDLGHGGGNGANDGAGEELAEPVTLFETSSQRAYGIAAEDTTVFLLLGTNDTMELVSCPSSGCGGAPTVLCRGTPADAARLWLTPIVKAGGWLFWMLGNGSTSGIASCPTSGGQSVAFVPSRPGSGSWGGLAGDGESVFWIDTGRALLRLSPGDTVPAVVRQSMNAPQSADLAVAGEFVYFTDAGNSRVYRVRKDGSTDAELVAEGDLITGLDGTPDGLYYSSQTLDGSITRCPLGGATCGDDTVIGNLRWPAGLRADGRELFWASGAPAFAAFVQPTRPVAALWSCALPGCAAPRQRVRELHFLSSSSVAPPSIHTSTFSLSRDFAFWLDEPVSGTVQVRRLGR